jgi:hypothetical protein
MVEILFMSRLLRVSNGALRIRQTQGPRGNPSWPGEIEATKILLPWFEVNAKTVGRGRRKGRAMSDKPVPVACLLTSSEFRQRRAEIVSSFRGAVVETVELENGYRYRFPTEATWITQLADFIAVERECCPFMQFDLRIEPANGPIWLELTGPEGIKDFLRSLFR